MPLLRFLVLFLVVATPALADEQLQPLAQAGDWIAVEHLDSITDPPDVCLAMEPSANFGIRADANDVELRLSNDSWALPAGVVGTLTIAVNGNKYPFDITSNTGTAVAATITNDQLISIVQDMNKAATMTVTVGNAAPVQVSLNGSNTVITAFLTCAGIQPPTGTNGGPGSNPFQSQPSQ